MESKTCVGQLRKELGEAKVALVNPEKELGKVKIALVNTISVLSLPIQSKT